MRRSLIEFDWACRNKKLNVFTHTKMFQLIICIVFVPNRQESGELAVYELASVDALHLPDLRHAR